MRPTVDDDDPVYASVAFAQLLSKTRSMLANSTHPDAPSFDAERWLRAWIRIPQPALGWRAPIELLDSVEGVASVLRVLGAIESTVFV